MTVKFLALKQRKEGNFWRLELSQAEVMELHYLARQRSSQKLPVQLSGAMNEFLDACLDLPAPPS